MHPPDSYNPYQSPAPGYQYPGQYGAQYPPQYPYPYYGPPPKQEPTSKILIIVIVVVVLVIVVPIILAGILVVYLQTLPQSGGEVETSLGLRATNQGNGNWLIDVTMGSRAASSVRLQVIDSNTGQTTVNKMVSSLAPTYADPDATYNDNNDNGKLDAGDTFILKSSGGHVNAGYRVQLLAGENVLGTIASLPG